MEKDLCDLLIHELGHTHGLTHSDLHSVLMFPDWGGIQVFPLRTLANGDKSGAIYQHPIQDWSGTLPYSIVLAADATSFNITSNLTIPSGITFEIESGKTLGFASGTALNVQGTLKASSSTFTGNNSYWNGIQLSGTGGAGNSVIEQCTISNISSGGAGITLNSVGGNPVIKYCTISNNSGASGIYIYNSNGEIIRNNINNNWRGIYIENQSEPYFGKSEYIHNCSQGNNTISGNSQYGVYASYICTPWIGFSSSSIYAKNRIFNNSNKDIYANLYSDVYAENTWYGTSSPLESQFEKLNESNIDHDPCSDCNPGAAFKLSHIKQESSVSLIKTNQGILDISDSITIAREYLKEKKYFEAINVYKSCITNSSNPKETLQALNGLLSILRETKDNNILSFFEKILFEKENMRQISLTTISNALVILKNYDKALEELKTIIKENPNSIYERESLVHTALICHFYKNDTKSALLILSDIENKYDDENLSIVKNLLGVNNKNYHKNIKYYKLNGTYDKIL